MPTAGPNNPICRSLPYQRHLVWTFFCLVLYGTGFSQSDSAIQNQPSCDSIELIATRQDETITLIRKLTLEAQAYLENGIDTTELSKEMDKVHYV